MVEKTWWGEDLGGKGLGWKRRGGKDLVGKRPRGERTGHVHVGISDITNDTSTVKHKLL